MSINTTIAIDAMGGDFGSKITVPAALKCLRLNPNLKIIMVGDEKLLTQILRASKHSFGDRIRVHHSSQCVEMYDSPSKVLRTKKDSSMSVAIKLVKNGEAAACVSAGNTGALMATARFIIKTIPGIDRPAIISTLPSIFGHTHVLDLGANVDSSAQQLFEFGVMGSELVKALENIDNPAIGLLNIGEEAIKGNEQVRVAAKLFASSHLNYIGFVEGDVLNAGATKVDLIVADGFVGNVALKSIEGAARMIDHKLKEAFKKNIFTKLAGLLAMPVLQAFKQKIDPRMYNGASFLGLRGIVIKSHGGADILAFSNAIHIAEVEIAKDILRRINDQVAIILSKGNGV